MKCFPDYKKATNAAYEILTRYGAFSFATDVFDIVEALLKNCKLLPYSETHRIYKYPLEALLSVSEFGFSIINKHTGQRIILYNECCSLGCIRFTIAHEIGHCVLKHIDENDAASEKEANCFARNLLCPIPIIYKLGVETIQDYIDVFEVTAQMAATSLNHQESDKYYTTQENWVSILDMLNAYKMGFPTLGAYYQFWVS